MGFQKISSLSLTDLFVQQIENMILSGELAVGEHCPASLPWGNSFLLPGSCRSVWASAVL